MSSFCSSSSDCHAIFPLLLLLARRSRASSLAVSQSVHVRCVRAPLFQEASLLLVGVRGITPPPWAADGVVAAAFRLCAFAPGLRRLRRPASALFHRLRLSAAAGSAASAACRCSGLRRLRAAASARRTRLRRCRAAGARAIAQPLPPPSTPRPSSSASAPSWPSPPPPRQPWRHLLPPAALAAAHLCSCLHACFHGLRLLKHHLEYRLVRLCVCLRLRLGSATARASSAAAALTSAAVCERAATSVTGASSASAPPLGRLSRASAAAARSSAVPFRLDGCAAMAAAAVHLKPSSPPLLQGTRRAMAASVGGGPPPPPPPAPPPWPLLGHPAAACAAACSAALASAPPPPPPRWPQPWPRPPLPRRSAAAASGRRALIKLHPQPLGTHEALALPPSSAAAVYLRLRLGDALLR